MLFDVVLIFHFNSCERMCVLDEQTEGISNSALSLAVGSETSIVYDAGSYLKIFDRNMTGDS